MLASALVLAGCRRSGLETAPLSVPASPAPALAGGSTVVRYTYEVIKAWPHDRGAFTQGLVFRQGSFIEITGLHGQSTLREVNVETGRVLKQVALGAAYFGEGVTVIGSRAFQLTWQNRKGFVYDADTFQLEREFAYDGEGWGLATDGTWLILSDGTSRLRFLDPASFEVKRSLDVTMAGKPLDRLNELEYVRGEIFANVWQTDDVVRIDPASGKVRGVIAFSGLLPPQDRRPDTDVLNGIAYHSSSDRLFVTGKRWPWVFEVKVKAQP
jgi:glutamine cyclotransferase